MRFLVLTFFFSLSFHLFSQKYNFINYTVENGLAQSQVNDINQDASGYLWIATESGLSKFDGLRFVNYSIDNGLPENKVEKIYIQDDELWVGTPSGLAKFEDERFTSFYFDSPKRVNDIIQFSGKIYVGTSTGLFRLDDNRFVEMLNDDPDKPYYIRALSNNNNEFLYCGTRTGLVKCNGEFEPLETQLLGDINISDIQFEEEKLIISTYGDGLLIYSTIDHSILPYDLRSTRIRSFCTNDDILLCATINGAIEIDGNDQIYYTEENGLVNESLKCTFIDKEGNYWMGTDGNGLLKSLGKSITTYSTEDGISSNIVMSISQELDSSFIFGTYREGLTILKDYSTTVYNESNNLKDNTVWDIHVDNSSNCWIATSKGLNLFRNGNIVSHPPTNGVDSKIRTIDQMHDTYFFGGSDGLYILQNDSLSFCDESTDLNINDLCAVENSLFIASRNGLYETSSSEEYSTLNWIELADNNVNSIVHDSRSYLWIGTMNGLFIRLPDGQIFPFILDKEDFNSKTVLGITEASSGDIWISTMSGVYQIEIEKNGSYSYRLSHFSTAEGLTNLESNLNAIYEDYSGNIWVGTSNGLAKIDPSLNENLFAFNPPKIHVTGIRLFMEEFDYGRFETEVDAETGIPTHITLPHNQNHLTFDFIGISLKNPESVKYEYRLLGSNVSWSPLSKANYATYSDIAPGDYEFQVRSTNKSLVWSETLSIKVTVLSPYWLTWWFLSLITIVLIIILIVIFQARIRAIKQKQENEKLGYKNRLLFLEQQSLNASMNRHFIFNSLNSIQYFINSSDKISANKYLSSFAKLIRKNLDSSTANNFIVTLQEEVERISLYLTLEKMRFQEKFEYELNVSSSLDTESIEIPSMILQPFVENSIIHGVLPLERKGNIKINIFEEYDEVVFEVIDDGIGIDTTLKNKKNQIDGDHQSKGMEITNRRIELLRKLTGDNLLIIGPFQLNDQNGNCQGTKVVIKMGLQVDQ